MATQHWKLVVAIAVACIQIVVAQLPPINPDNLDPEMAHVCTSTVDESYTQLQYYQHYKIVRTRTWCWSKGRCSKYSLQSESATKIVTLSRQRLSYSCCNGYHTDAGISYCIPTCVDDCNSGAQQGTCIAPDRCICKHGFRGELCESNCTLGTWGQDCLGTCDCDDSYGACDASNGNCICHVGYTGQDCSQACRGSFGLHCQYQCVCENGATCNNINGKCMCPPGYDGAYCHKSCPAGTHGQGCVHVCKCQNGANCSSETGHCICNYGYMGEICNIPCDANHWGRGCQENCTCYHGGQCNSQSGACICPMGYGGDSCQDECATGFYGNDCLTKCACENGGTCYYGNPDVVACNCSDTGYHGNTCTNRSCGVFQYVNGSNCANCNCDWDHANSCDPATGHCSCIAGYQGVRCNASCDWPYFGAGCKEVCTCKHGQCDSGSGTCLSCEPGYTGANCDAECMTGKWGLNCSSDCQCYNGAKCDHRSGYCRCTAGWRGFGCTLPCPVGRYGDGCSGNCTCDVTKSMCNPIDGTCQCLPGYYGDACSKCESMKFGFHCLRECHCLPNGTRHCDHRTGECLCKSGWKGVDCSSTCNDGTWGEGCSKSCDCNNHGSCDQQNGTCACYAGYIGNHCENTCANGSFGMRCEETCTECISDGVCDFITGICPLPTTCPAGLMGEYCQTMCPQGSYGPGCIHTCAPTCATPQGICNPVSGACHCYMGYTGTQCEAECEDGTYGSRCAYKCACIPAHTQRCSHDHGSCLCKPGYHGFFCENECADLTWGPDCRFNCADICDNFTSCDHVTGSPCVCTHGYEGKHCQRLTSASVTEQNIGDDTSSVVNPKTIGIAVAAGILLILLIAIVTYYHRRVARLQTENFQVRFDGQTNIIRDMNATPNGGSLGLSNPMYESDNVANERRYPHLTSRLSFPPPDLAGCESSQDNCVEECRPTSGIYMDTDEDRYATSESIIASATNNDSNDDLDTDDETRRNSATNPNIYDNMSTVRRPTGIEGHGANQSSADSTSAMSMETTTTLDDIDNETDLKFTETGAGLVAIYPTLPQAVAEKSNTYTIMGEGVNLHPTENGSNSRNLVDLGNTRYPVTEQNGVASTC